MDGSAKRLGMGPRVWALVVVLLALPGWASAQAARPDPPGREAEVTVASAPLVVDGVTLFRVRGVSAYPAERRAREIAARIRDAAGDPAISPAAARVVEAEGGSSILLATRVIMTVFDADAQLERIDRPTLAAAYATRIAEAVERYRQSRAPRVLLVNTAYALVATAGLAGVLLAVRWGFRWLAGALERRQRARPAGVRVRAFQVLYPEQVSRVLRAALGTARIVVVLVVLYAYLQFVLELYPWTRPLSRRLVPIVLDPLAIIGAGLLDAVPSLGFIAILAVITRYALRMLWLFFAGLQNGRVAISGFDPDWAWPTYRLVRVLVVAFALVVAYPYIPGSDTDAFKGVSLFLGVVFSIGSTSAISNIMAGYTVTYRRAFRVGDRVKIGEYVGDVVDQRLLVTHLRSPKNEEVVIPNSAILNREVVNYSTIARQQGVILHTTVGIGYETPWRQVEAILLEAARRTPGLRSEPPPFVLERALGDFCVTYELNAYSDDPQTMERQYAALHRNVLDVFNEYGVQIMTPNYEADPPQPKVVPREQWFAEPARQG